MMFTLEDNLTRKGLEDTLAPKGLEDYLAPKVLEDTLAPKGSRFHEPHVRFCGPLRRNRGTLAPKKVHARASQPLTKKAHWVPFHAKTQTLIRRHHANRYKTVFALCVIMVGVKAMNRRPGSGFPNGQLAPVDFQPHTQVHQLGAPMQTVNIASHIRAHQIKKQKERNERKPKNQADLFNDIKSRGCTLAGAFVLTAATILTGWKMMDVNNVDVIEGPTGSILDPVCGGSIVLLCIAIVLLMMPTIMNFGRAERASKLMASGITLLMCVGSGSMVVNLYLLAGKDTNTTVHAVGTSVGAAILIFSIVLLFRYYQNIQEGEAMAQNHNNMLTGRIFWGLLSVGGLGVAGVYSGLVFKAWKAGETGTSRHEYLDAFGGHAVTNIVLFGAFVAIFLGIIALVRSSYGEGQQVSVKGMLGMCISASVATAGWMVGINGMLMGEGPAIGMAVGGLIIFVVGIFLFQKFLRHMIGGNRHACGIPLYDN